MAENQAQSLMVKATELQCQLNVIWICYAKVRELVENWTLLHEMGAFGQI